QLLARKLVVIRTRLRSVHGAAVTPQRRTDGAYTGASRPLLPPQFLSASCDQFAVLGGMCAGPLRGAVMFHRFPQQVLVDRAEDFVFELQRSDFFALQINNVNLRHSLLVAASH